MPRIVVGQARKVTGSRYPAPFDTPCRQREVWRLGDAVALTQFGVNVVRLPPGTWSSQRHWHAIEDEFVYVLRGEVTMLTDAGAETLRAGDCAGFKGGVRDGHCFQNLGTGEVELLVVGGRSDEDHGEYSDIDMKFGGPRYSGQAGFAHKDGTPY